MEQPKEITVCDLACIVMPSGEIISGGVSLGFIFEKVKKHLTKSEQQ